MYLRRVAVTAVFLAWAGFISFPPRGLATSFQQTSAAPAKMVGTIKAINANTITLAPDAGSEIAVQVDPATRIVRVEPGQKDLKNATALQLTDLQVGDRILVRGKTSDNQKSVLASVVLAMKQTDVAAKQQRERQEWQRHGIDGVVSAIDPLGRTITITVPTLTGKKTTLVKVSTTSIVRRYAPDSVKFEDAKPARLDQIKIGDQLRAHGTRSSEGTEFDADEVVAGTFATLTSTIISVEPTASTMHVTDLESKKPLLVRVSAESLIHKLPAETAQLLAMRLKGDMPPGAGRAGETNPRAGGTRPEGTPALGQGRAEGGTDFPHRTGMNFQQAVNRAPLITLRDLHKGDAVVILRTEGATAGEATAVQIVAGVEPILAASPKGSQPMILSPWSLGGGAGEEAAQ
jgi:hypothetical protein